MESPTDRPIAEAGATERGAVAPAAAPHSFGRRLSWSVVGGLVGGATLFGMNVVAGRVLGPAGYGQAAVAFALANVFIIVFAAGLDLSAARAVARSHADPGTTARLISTAAAGVALVALVMALVLSGLRELVGGAIDQSGTLVVVAIALGVLLAFRSLFDRMISGLQRFRWQAAGRIAEGLVGLTVVVALAVLLDDPAWWLLPVALGVAASVAIVTYASAMTRMLRPSLVSLGSFLTLASFGRWAIVAYVTGTLFMFGDKLVVASIVGDGALGVYNAYYMTSMAVMVQLVAVFNNVLLPAVARRDVDHALVRRLDRAALRAVPMTAVVIAAVLPIALRLFGDGFPLRLELLASFVAWCVLFGLNQVYAVLVTAHSERAFRRDMLFQPIRIALALGALVLGVQLLGPGLVPVLLALIFAEALEQANIQWILRRYLPTIDEKEARR